MSASYAKCYLFVVGLEMHCPLCGELVRSGERHACETPKPQIVIDNPNSAIARRNLIDRTCPDCGHVHHGDDECGEELGGGRVCRCERRVPA